MHLREVYNYSFRGKTEVGYFQGKAGGFHLDIPPGRGQEIFKLDSAGNEGWDSLSIEAGVITTRSLS